jgi:RNA polymerase sigma-70 factor (ECF subfamily)
MTNSPTTEFGRALLAIVPQLRVFARSLCRRQDEADDLVQETLLRAWEARDSLRTPDKIKPWALTILRNAYNIERRKRRFQVEDGDGTFAAQLSVSDAQSVSVDFHDVMKAFDKLSAEHRDVIMLICVQGLSYEDAARICGTAVGTIKSRLSRARNSLAASLGIGGVIDIDTEAQIRSVLTRPVSPVTAMA